jgi:hypothetical protein
MANETMSLTPDAIPTTEYAGKRGWARPLAVVAAALITIAVLLVWFTVDRRLPSDTATSYVPFVLLLTVPLWFAARRLRRHDDALGLLVAFAASVLLVAVALFAPIWIAAHMSAADRGYFPLLLVGILLPPFGRATATAALSVVVLLSLMVAVRRAWRASSNRQLRLGGDGLIAAAVFLVSAGAVGTNPPRPLTTARADQYSSETVQHELLHAYTCLWRAAGPGAVHGFPGTLGECQWPDAAPGSAAFGAHYALEYHPARRDSDGRARGFVLSTVDVVHRDPESFYLDESGAVRRTTGARATVASPVWFGTGCGDIQAQTHAIEEYRTANPAIGYPAQFAAHVLGRTLIYRRVGNRFTLSLSTADSLPPADASLMNDPRLHLLRNFFRDTNGVTHATGELRPATMVDPVVSLDRCE